MYERFAEWLDIALDIELPKELVACSLSLKRNKKENCEGTKEI